MRLTRYTDYALRTLIYLGLHEPRQSSIAEIARAYDISESHLTKVVHQLGRLGLIRTTRGRGGGLRLGRPPGEIVVGAVVRQTEDDLALVECFRAALARSPRPAGEACTRRGSGGLPGSSRPLHAGGPTGGWGRPGDLAAPGYFFTNTDSVQPLDLRPQDVTLRYGCPVSLLTGSRQSTRGRSSARPRPALVAPRCVLSTTVAQTRTRKILLQARII